MLKRPRNLVPISPAELVVSLDYGVAGASDVGGLHHGNQGNVLQSRLRFFSPERRRTGLTDDVASLVETLTHDEVAVTFVNVHQLAWRRMVIQAGGDAAHEFVEVSVAEGAAVSLGDRKATLNLDSGCGGRLVFKTKRCAHRPTMLFPGSR